MVINAQKKSKVEIALQREREASLKKKHFVKEVYLLMYGFGDTNNPDPKTVELMEQLLVNYIFELCVETQTLSPRPTVTEFLEVLKREPRKYKRAQQLLQMDRELRKARIIFNDISVGCLK